MHLTQTFCFKMCASESHPPANKLLSDSDVKKIDFLHKIGSALKATRDRQIHSQQENNVSRKAPVFCPCCEKEEHYSKNGLSTL